MSRNRLRFKSLAACRAFWKKHVAAWQVSGLSLSEYSRQQQLPLSSLSHWKRKLSRLSPAPPPSPGNQEAVSLIQVPETLLRPSPELFDDSAVLMLSLCCGRFQVEVPRGFSGDLLRELVHALEGFPPGA